MISSHVQAGRGIDLAGAGPAIASVAAAFASLAFFRIWGFFSMSLAGPGQMELSGAALARDIKGPIPWLYVTPAALLAIVVVCGVRLADPEPKVRFAYSILLALVASALLVWPADALVKISRRFSHLQTLGEGAMRLTPWWWVYCLSLVTVMAFGIIELVLMIRNYLENHGKADRATH